MELIQGAIWIHQAFSPLWQSLQRPKATGPSPIIGRLPRTLPVLSSGRRVKHLMRRETPVAGRAPKGRCLRLHRMQLDHVWAPLWTGIPETGHKLGMMDIG